MLNDLYTTHGENLAGIPWQAYPRPQLRRESYVNLNGPWEFGIGKNAFPSRFDRTILVPFCPESLLSGIHEHFPEGSALCYRRTFFLPDDFNRGRVLLHIGAADQHLTCFINDKKIGNHIGGYTAFTFDITDALVAGENEIKFRCHDDLNNRTLPYGKQALNRGGMWYTPVSGIWQTVWLESVPGAYIQELDIQVTLEKATVTVTPALSGKITCEGAEYPLVDGKAVITPELPHPWSPEDPYLYEFTVEAGEDRVESYFALRTIETKILRGKPRLCFNGKPYFFHGLLDQGYWPDGIYTPASPACYAEDIMAMKRLGFNTLRKHIKVEPEAFYHLCDRLGMIVFQDFVNNGDYSFLRDTALPTAMVQKISDKRMHPDENTRHVFLETMEATVKQLKNHPCILYWTIFNEGWGQFDADSVYEELKKLDKSRIIDATSGWFRQKKSDVDSRHIYFTPWVTLQPSDKPLVLSEFGGYACPVEGHLFNPDKAYGYKSCKSLTHFQESIETLYRTKVIPAIKRGLCGAIITQVSDVEDEINGFLTYDRKINKADEKAMQLLAADLQKTLRRS